MLKEAKINDNVVVTIELLTGEIFHRKDICSSSEHSTNIWDGNDVVSIPTHNIKWIKYHNMEVNTDSE